MSRNLCTSQCCGRILRLSDLRGKPVEFRQYGSYSPQMGVRWDCPLCGEAYFAYIHQREKSFVIDLSYWTTYNDEPCYDPEITKQILSGERDPGWICKHDAEELQELWGCDDLESQ